jgi:cytochrome c oxidase subunit 1
VTGTTTPESLRRVDRLERIWDEPSGVVGWLTTTDHKRIGILYLFTALVFFALGGLEALLIRTQLLHPESTLVGPGTFNQALTMHGVTMIFFFIIPISTGAFGNYLLPLMIGARDMAFPRLNAASYWIFLGSGIFIYAGAFSGHAPNAGWFNYVPLSSRAYSPGPGIDFYCLGLIFNGISSTIAAINFIVTIFKLRAPGMSLNRMPLFAFAFLAVSFALVFALPALTLDCVLLELQRRLGFQFFDPAHGGTPILWQHLFWFFGHPEVYIIALPFFGIVTEILPVFSRKPIFGYVGLVGATLGIAILSVAVWAHHMFVTGAVDLPFFSGMTFLIAVPTGVKFFNWIGTMWRGQLSFETPMLFAVGFLVTFLLGGITGVMLASPPIDFHVSDTYFVVAHFHYVLFGTVVFAFFGGVYYWFPKLTGRMLNDRLGKVHFWTLFVGFHLTFLVQHWLGAEGMPRRIADYGASEGFTTLNTVSSIGAFVLGASTLPFIYNVVVSFRRGEKAIGDDPWGFGNSLEWATSCPPPRHNFVTIPRIRSERPAFDLHYPQAAGQVDYHATPELR